MKIIIGSRGSDLALWQANHVKDRLSASGIESEIKIIKTQGDAIQHLSFDKLEGKGFFTKEIEDALLAKEIDLAVHSHKDLPTTSPKGLIIAAVSEREDPAELLLINKSAVDKTRKFNLKERAVVGTSSARRKSQMLSFRNELVLQELRGNVPTRIQKLRDKKYDAILLAAAGVERLKLDLSDFHVERLSPEEFIPAPAQGVLALQVREDDAEIIKALQKIHNADVAKTIAVERKILNLFDGGCQLPLGVYCTKQNGKYFLRTSKSKAWNTFPVRILKSFDATDLEDPVKLAKETVDKINNLKPASVFITRDLDEDSYFQKALSEHGFAVNGTSLITTSLIRFTDIPKTDWIFFSSKNCVRYFFQQVPEIADSVKFGVIGKGTEALLKSFGKIPEFVGEGSSTVDIGNAFSKAARDGSILFPQAKDSLQSIQKKLSFSNKVYDLYVYKTLPKQEFQYVPSEIIVFTSPSNVDAFFSKHEISSGQKTVAIGPSTAKELEKHGIKNYALPYSFDEVGLAETVFSI